MNGFSKHFDMVSSPQQNQAPMRSFGTSKHKGKRFMHSNQGKKKGLKVKKPTSLGRSPGTMLAGN